jgi:GNAT superfamily N-acetyltransferase
LKYLPAIAASLLPDPFYQAITVESPTTADQQLVLESYFQYSFAEGTRTGRCVVAPQEEDGAAIWLLPREPQVQARESQEKTRFMRELLGPSGSENYHRIVDFMSPLAERHIPNNAWYLSIIGVRPAAQGKGLGVRLLTPTLEEADLLGVPTYLETFTPRNVPFYARLGFKTLAEYDEPVTESAYVIMRRDAKRS